MKQFVKNKVKMYKILWPSWGRSLIYWFGCLFFSFGAKFFIDSKLGVDPLDVLVFGIVKHVGLTIGIVSGAIAIFFLVLWTFWNRKWPPISPFVTMSFVGTLIDVWNWTHLEKITTLFLAPFPMMIAGLILTIIQKWRWSFFWAKMLFEIGFLTSGWFLGGACWDRDGFIWMPGRPPYPAVCMGEC